MPTLTVKATDSVGNQTLATRTFGVVSGETILTGDIDAIIPAGTVARLRGNCRLINNLHVRGTLIADPTGVNLDGQGLWDIHTHDGGVLNLVGVEKTGWVLWGDPVVGWQVGDRVAVAPMVPGNTIPVEMTWSGDWATMTRPAACPNVVLRDGRVMRPEVAQLNQTMLIRNVTRIMFHESDGLPNVHTLKWLRVLNSGKTGQLTFYPIHFHLLNETTIGSYLEGVVVEGGKNHAFVPHGSDGITFKDCVAYKTAMDPYFWDPVDSAGYVGGGADSSSDILYDHCLAMKMSSTANHPAGFRLAAGVNNKALHCHATCMSGAPEGSGFHWRHDTSTWLFEDCVSHNNPIYGFHVWQNTEEDHPLDRLIAFNCTNMEYDHGAYGNLYEYRDCYGDKFRLHAKSEESPGEVKFLNLQRVDILSLEVTKHQLGRFRPMHITDCKINTVVYNEYDGFPSWIQYRDCHTQAGVPLASAHFTLTKIRSGTVIELFEGGVLTHRWAGAWT